MLTRAPEMFAAAAILIGQYLGSTTPWGAALFALGGGAAALVTARAGLPFLTFLNSATVVVAMLTLVGLYVG